VDHRSRVLLMSPSALVLYHDLSLAKHISAVRISNQLITHREMRSWFGLWHDRNRG